MKNQKGEIATIIMVVMMAGMMIFGMAFMHGGHGGRRDDKSGQGVPPAEKGPQPATAGDEAPKPAPTSAGEDSP